MGVKLGMNVKLETIRKEQGAANMEIMLSNASPFHQCNETYVGQHILKGAPSHSMCPVHCSVSKLRSRALAFKNMLSEVVIDRVNGMPEALHMGTCRCISRPRGPGFVKMTQFSAG